MKIFWYIYFGRALCGRYKSYIKFKVTSTFLIKFRLCEFLVFINRIINKYFINKETNLNNCFRNGLKIFWYIFFGTAVCGRYILHIKLKVTGIFVIKFCLCEFLVFVNRIINKYFINIISSLNNCLINCWRKIWQTFVTFLIHHFWKNTVRSVIITHKFYTYCELSQIILLLKMHTFFDFVWNWVFHKEKRNFLIFVGFWSLKFCSLKRMR